MQISATASLQPTTPKARSLVRNITPEGVSLVPEKTEEEKRLESSSLPIQKELTPEEKNRVAFLKNMLSQLLSMGDGQPTEEQKARIKEVENEIAKITGVKPHSSIADATHTMPKKKDDDEDEAKRRHIAGIDPKEAQHFEQEKTGKNINPGMVMLQKNAFFAQLASSLEKTNALHSFSAK
ncbi:hypothetical protein GO013_09930 [Pseudodesulfovibrio sp. JC047]|uniref:hypothetical protein n=1 Tax=Pseudodesulfovibrio sp. JC047 TaxID=2683199 RepID=UPI0013D6F950|nr:hypothetical protein [Pseudodesulfovibrio sp. JC047]NDV19737.1 hypothetical protein [Pseudodesulfovibrio sp. JC047]